MLVLLLSVILVGCGNDAGPSGTYESNVVLTDSEGSKKDAVIELIFMEDGKGTWKQLDESYQMKWETNKENIYVTQILEEVENTYEGVWADEQIELGDKTFNKVK